MSSNPKHLNVQKYPPLHKRPKRQAALWVPVPVPGAGRGSEEDSLLEGRSDNGGTHLMISRRTPLHRVFIAIFAVCNTIRHYLRVTFSQV